MKTTKQGKSSKLYFRRQSSLEDLYSMHQDDAAFSTSKRKRNKDTRQRKAMETNGGEEDEHDTALSSLERTDTSSSLEEAQNEIPSIQGRISHELLGQVTTFHDVDKAQRLLSEIESKTERLIFVVKFTLPYVASFGQQLRVTGSLPQLGEWDASKAPKMEWTTGDVWTCEHSRLFQDKKTSFEYKYLVSDEMGNPVRWEGGPNKRFSFDFDTLSDEERSPNMKIEVSSNGVVTIVMQDKWQA